MIKYIVIILVLILQSCTGNHKSESSFERNLSHEIVSESTLPDSIELYLKPEGRDQENLFLCARNPRRK